MWILLASLTDSYQDDESIERATPAGRIAAESCGEDGAPIVFETAAEPSGRVEEDEAPPAQPAPQPDSPTRRPTIDAGIARYARAVPASEASGNGNGDTSTARFAGAAGGEARLELTLYLHPGRARLGLVSIEQARAQFDLAAATLFATLADAELAADEAVGFLAELHGPFVDSGGTRREHAVLYIPRLKP